MIQEWPKMLRRINPATNKIEKKVFASADDIPVSDGWTSDTAKLLEVERALSNKTPLSDPERNQIEVQAARIVAMEQERDALRQALDASQDMITAQEREIAALRALAGPKADETPEPAAAPEPKKKTEGKL